MDTSLFWLAMQAGVCRQTSADLEREGADALTIIHRAVDQFGDHIGQALGYGAEGMVLLDLLLSVNPRAKVFTLDTGYLFPETYELMDRVDAHYGIKVIRFGPEDQDVQTFNQKYGKDADRNNGHGEVRAMCCEASKRRPFERALHELDLRAWLTSNQRWQRNHENTQLFSLESRANLRLMVKVCPLAGWTQEQTWAYLREHDVPYNTLHDQGYPSIGCTHCTRKVVDGEDYRAGRFSGSDQPYCPIQTASTLVQIL